MTNKITPDDILDIEEITEKFVCLLNESKDRIGERLTAFNLLVISTSILYELYEIDQADDIIAKASMIGFEASTLAKKLKNLTKGKANED